MTVQYQSGAQAALKLARQEGCTMAILKARSPSCGKGKIYDGSFSGNLVPGDGAAARCLSEAGFLVLDEDEAKDYFKMGEEGKQ